MTQGQALAARWRGCGRPPAHLPNRPDRPDRHGRGLVCKSAGSVCRARFGRQINAGFGNSPRHLLRFTPLYSVIFRFLPPRFCRSVSIGTAGANARLRVWFGLRHHLPLAALAGVVGLQINAGFHCFFALIENSFLTLS